MKAPARSIAPENVALVFDGERWSLREAPPEWWWDLMDALEEADTVEG